MGKLFPVAVRGSKKSHASVPLKFPTTTATPQNSDMIGWVRDSNRASLKFQTQLRKHLKPRGRKPSGLNVVVRLEIQWSTRQEFFQLLLQQKK